MSQLHELKTSDLRPLPVLLLADVSGSMSGDGKIASLNQAVREMISTFAAAEEILAEILVAVITFGEEARVHIPLTSAAAVSWLDMQADGSTPMGRAMELAAELLEDRDLIPKRAYRPTVVLVSDGVPTDAWEAGLARLTQQGRAQKADRMALAIGGDADEAMLKRFIADPAKPVYRAEDARRIKDFFQLVTKSVTMTSRGANPVPVMQSPFDLDKF